MAPIANRFPDATSQKRSSRLRAPNELLWNSAPSPISKIAGPAAHSPVLHLRRLPGGQLFDHYQASFERVWEQASTDNVPTVLAQGGRR
jgi:hypothetical protein